jgi:DNA-binding beta-propeller fold protein YncE
MQHARRHLIPAAALAAAALGASVLLAQAPAQSPSMPPTNDAPNPYETVTGYFRLPEGRTWGSTSAVDVAPDGKTIWVAERCGANSCWDSTTNTFSPYDVVLKFDASGRLLDSFGQGMFVFPHGIHVDREGNVWVTDGQDNLPRRDPNAPGDGPSPPMPDRVVGHQVYKFSPEGKLLMTLGKPGGRRPGEPFDPTVLYQPNDVLTLPNGDILVAEGHSDAGPVHRIVRFNKDGRYIGEIGKKGSGPGEFIQPHGLALTPDGNLIVADRSNNRVQILTTDGAFIREFYSFSRPSGVAVGPDGLLYVADSESGSVTRDPTDRSKVVRTEWTRGIRIGSLTDGRIVAFIPDPEKDARSGTRHAEGVAVDAAGNVYAAEVGPRRLTKYVRKK